jgi:predicted PurR-regulated permease PerM
MFLHYRIPVYLKITIVLLLLILFFHAIIMARDFLYPIVFGVLFGYLLYPIAVRLERNGFPRIIANLISILFFISVVGAILFFIYKQAGNLLDDFPQLKQRALGNIDSLENMIEKQFGLRDLRLADYLRLRVRNLFESGSDFINHTFSTTAGTLFRMAILPVYIFIFLFYRTKIAYFILKVVQPQKKLTALKVLREFSTVVPRYMGGISTVVLILCFLNTGGLLIVGIEYPLIFGIISALCTFIPYFGTLIGGAIPFGFALLTGDSPTLALQVGILFLILNFIENNILTPNIVGGSLRINAMVVIVGLIAAGMVWGIPGMFVIVPLLGMFNIFSENVEQLHPYSFLLGVKGARRHAITVENIKKLVARMKKKRNISKK